MTEPGRLPGLIHPHIKGDAALSRPNLFSPLELRGVTLKNRILISPMWQYCAEFGHPTDHHVAHYGSLAAGGAGLVMQEGTTVEKRGRGTPGDLGIWDDEFVPGLARLVELVKSKGATPGIQLMHPGRKVQEHAPWKWADGNVPLTEEEKRGLDPEDWDRMAPSPVPQMLYPDHPIAREMTLQDIRQVIDAFVQAAVRADEAGYEVVEIHAAHGYLIHLFLSEATNQRTDAYGGSFENRTRFLREIVEGVRAALPDEKPLLVRISCLDGSSWSMPDTIRLAKLLKELGVDMIDCSMGGIQKDIGADRRSAYAYQRSLAHEVKRDAGVRTNAVGLIVHAHHANAIIENGHADTVAIGRESIYNPYWPIDAAHKLGLDPGFESLPDRQGFWLKYREMGMQGFLPSTYANADIPPLEG